MDSETSHEYKVSHEPGHFSFGCTWDMLSWAKSEEKQYGY